ncbi:MAG TPA: ABC transporter ATP-binding protein [Ilumatobacteraceae bacterium]|nr:ABC transporter ATP-binding protein [Ilumatobacteraceae bacterium]
MSPHPFVRLWHHARNHRRRLVLAGVMSTINKACDVVPELLIGVAIDVVVRGNTSFLSSLFGVSDRFDQLLLLAALNIGAWLLESLTDFLAHVLWRNLAQAVQHDLRLATYRHVQDLEVAWFEDNTSGGLLAVLNDDINQLERFLDHGPDDILQTFWNIVFVGAVFLVASPKLWMLAFVPIPIIVLGSVRYQRRLEPLYDGVRERVADLSALLSGNLGGIATIKAFTAEQREAERLDAVSQAYVDANGRAIRFSSAFIPLIRMVILAGFTCTLVIGGRMVIDNDLEVGVYSVLVDMTQRLLWPLTRLGETLDLYQRSMASVRRVSDLLETTPKMVNGSGTLTSPVRGEIDLRDIRFGYGDGGNAGDDVLRGISMHIPAGETHAVVGATGAGKSTITKLLLRLHDPRAGVVSIDGSDVRDLSYVSLRSTIGYVSQDVFLFQGTVRDNLRFGRPDATDAQVEAAAIAAEAHEFIVKLPDGYDTIVGERGQKLSGGQRQRLSIARAIVRDPAILVLDEATSAVDNETEAAIQRSLARVAQNRTAVVIAHRLSTVRDADKIWVLEGGQIIESGTHDELVATHGLYAALWRVQTGSAAREHIAD